MTEDEMGQALGIQGQVPCQDRLGDLRGVRPLGLKGRIMARLPGEVEINGFAGLVDVGRGSLNGSFVQAVNAVLDDCRARPPLAHPRKVVVELAFTPECDDTGKILMQVKMEGRVRAKMPEYRMMETMCRPGPNGLIYQTMDPKNPGQRALPYDEDEKGGEE